MNQIVLIDYGAGNMRSVKLALRRLNIEPIVTRDHDLIMSSDKVILPGVGEAQSAMEALNKYELPGVIKALKQPVLGVCLGMQLLCLASEERDTTCLGLIPLRVKRLQGDIKVPHMGWNDLSQPKGPLFKGIGDHEFMYFVHSYYVPDSDFTIARADYGLDFAAAIRKNNFFGCQFHPEKSGPAGQIILQNFLDL